MRGIRIRRRQGARVEGGLQLLYQYEARRMASGGGGQHRLAPCNICASQSNLGSDSILKGFTQVNPSESRIHDSR